MELPLLIHSSLANFAAQRIRNVLLKKPRLYCAYCHDVKRMLKTRTRRISHGALLAFFSNKMASISQPDYEEPGDVGEERVKVICLGDSAVGKSKLVERFLMDGYKPQQLSTYALTLFNHREQIDGKTVSVDFWDTAGQERFNSMHPSYYHQAHACILVFDCSRKVTYKNLPEWLKDLRQYRPEIPCLCAANKIDENMDVTKKSFAFAKKHGMPFYFVSAADGTNVVRLFRDAIRAALAYKHNSTDFMDEIMKELENFKLDPVPTKSKDKPGDTVENGDKEKDTILSTS